MVVQVQVLFWAQRIKKAFVIQAITKAFLFRGRIGDGFGVNVWVVCLHLNLKKLIMKFFIPSLVLLFSFMTCTINAQNYEHSEIIEVVTLDKNQYYVAIKSWLPLVFKSAQFATQYDDKNEGLIIVKGSFPYNAGNFGTSQCYEGFINFNIKFEIKEGKARITFNNFIHENLPTRSSTCNLGLITIDEQYTNKGLAKSSQNKEWVKIKERIDVFVENMFLDLDKHLTSTTTQDNNDW
jgi:hypothetical protein